MTHEELQELIPAYALDALGAEEEMEVKAHLASCDDCRELLAPLAETAGALALALPPVAPPPRLRERILMETEPAPHSPPLSLPRRTMWRRVGAAVAAAVVVVMGLVNVLLINRLSDRERQLEEQNQLVDVLASGSVNPTPMVAADGAPGVSGRIFVARDAQSAAIVMTGLPRPDEGVYQLWLLRDGKPIPLDSFRPDVSGAAFVYVQAHLESMGGMAVTLEDRPSLPAPKGPAILRTA
jgi:anti-sigma factor RsiW